jgi:hypothetical protein
LVLRYQEQAEDKTLGGCSVASLDCYDRRLIFEIVNVNLFFIIRNDSVSVRVSSSAVKHGTANKAAPPIEARPRRTTPECVPLECARGRQWIALDSILKVTRR